MDHNKYLITDDLITPFCAFLRKMGISVRDPTSAHGQMVIPAEYFRVPKAYDRDKITHILRKNKMIASEIRRPAIKDEKIKEDFEKMIESSFMRELEDSYNHQTEEQKELMEDTREYSLLLDGARDLGHNNSRDDTLSLGDQGSMDEDISEKPEISKTLDPASVWSQYKQKSAQHLGIHSKNEERTPTPMSPIKPIREETSLNDAAQPSP